jgi:hypothetical protein
MLTSEYGKSAEWNQLKTFVTRGRIVTSTKKATANEARLSRPEVQRFRSAFNADV